MSEVSKDLKLAIEYHKSRLLQDQELFQRNYDRFLQYESIWINQTHEAPETEETTLEKLSKNVEVIENNIADLMLASDVNYANSLRNLRTSNYGLPGLGEHDERRKQLLDERKKDYLNYLNEQNEKTKNRSRVNSNAYLDYEELLAQKRQLEYNYRHLTSDPFLSNNVIKPYKSETNVNKIEDIYNPRSLKDQHSNTLSSSNDYLLQRPHSYPPEISLGVYSNLDSRRNAFEDSGKRSADLPLLTYEYDRNSRPGALSDSFSRYRWKSEEQRRAEYQADLSKQIEADRLKKAKMKAEEDRLNQKLEEENRNYDPWGRGGAGAPRRDRFGNVIASRCQVEDFRSEKPKDKTEPNQNNNNVKSQAVAEANYTVHRSPPSSRATIPIRDERQAFESYKDDLKRQMEEKKLRDQLEKEKERLEDEKLARRIQEQQDKMKREYEEEQKKQRLREEERRRRNEDLHRKHDEHKREASRRRREVNDEKRRNHREIKDDFNNHNGGKEEELYTQHLDNSPPVPSLKSKHDIEPRRDSKDHANLSSQGQVQSNGSRNHILSQLSTMRQQLEKEQQQIQEQLRKQSKLTTSDDDISDYYSTENYTQSDDIKNSIYKPVAIHKSQDENNPEHTRNMENKIGPKVKNSRRMPVAALPLRTQDGFAPLQGDSLFLGVDGYDSGKAQNKINGHTSHITNGLQGEHYDNARLADQEAARKRYLHAVSVDPDEVKADSFLDEYLARNINK